MNIPKPTKEERHERIGYLIVMLLVVIVLALNILIIQQ